MTTSARSPWLRVARALSLLLLALACVAPGRAEERHWRLDTVTILHTNDVHDSLKTRANGAAGLALVSGYARRVRAERRDVLLLDAGDVCEKGDMLGVLSQGEMGYRAMAAVGYDAAAPGNHDFVYGVPKLLSNVRAARFPLLCCNTVYADTGVSILPPAIERDVDGVRVGILAGTISGGGDVDGRKVQTVKLEDLGRKLHALAQEMEPRVQLIVAVVHQSSASCRKLAAAAPEVDVFVSGHSHERLQQPIRLESGALIVQAGQYAQYVGRLEVTVDLDTEEVVAHQGRLVPMERASVTPDAALAEQVRAWNAQVCPNAARVVGRAPEVLGGKPLCAWLAEAVRRHTGADVALFSDDIVRRGLTPGPVTEDDLWATMVSGSRRNLAVATVSGADLLAFLDGRLAGKAKTHMAGAALTVDAKKPAGQRIPQHDLDPARQYRVAGVRALVRALGGTAVTEREDTAFDAAIAYATAR